MGIRLRLEKLCTIHGGRRDAPEETALLIAGSFATFVCRNRWGTPGRSGNRSEAPCGAVGDDPPRRAGREVRPRSRAPVSAARAARHSSAILHDAPTRTPVEECPPAVSSAGMSAPEEARLGSNRDVGSPPTPGPEGTGSGPRSRFRALGRFVPEALELLVVLDVKLTATARFASHVGRTSAARARRLRARRARWAPPVRARPTAPADGKGSSRPLDI
jgi:hypothetical protein